MEIGETYKLNYPGHNYHNKNVIVHTLNKDSTALVTYEDNLFKVNQEQLVSVITRRSRKANVGKEGVTLRLGVGNSSDIPARSIVERLGNWPKDMPYVSANDLIITRKDSHGVFTNLFRVTHLNGEFFTLIWETKQSLDKWLYLGGQGTVFNSFNEALTAAIKRSNDQQPASFVKPSRPKRDMSTGQEGAGETPNKI